MTADHTPPDVSSEAVDTALSPRTRIARLWAHLPMWEKAAAVFAVSLIALAGIAATTIHLPESKKPQIAAERIVVTPVAVSDKWEDLGVYLKKERVGATPLVGLQKQAQLQKQQQELDNIRAQLQSPSLPKSVEVQPRKSRKAVAIAKPASDVATEAKPQPAKSLISEGAKETLGDLEAFKLAMRDVGLKQGDAGLSAYKE